MFELFLEDGDLLENVEMMRLIEKEDIITEASIAGMKITKENLQDEKYVKELINKIKNNKHPVRDLINMFLLVVGVISIVSIVAIPVGILIIVLADKIKSSNQINKNDLEKLDKNFDKVIKEFEKSLNKEKDVNKKKDLENIIDQLKHNKESIYNLEKAKQILDSIDRSKYNKNGDIKLGSISIDCIIGDILSYNDKSAFDAIKSYSEDKSKLFKNNNTNGSFEYIEQFAANGITSQSEFTKFINNKTLIKGTQFGMGDYDENSDVYKLRNKRFVVIFDDVHDQVILYSVEDKCCYYWVTDDYDYIKKISVQQLLEASKTAYNDLMKVIKEYEKK